MKKKFATVYMAQAAVIAAVYVALTLAFQPISFGAIQFRISEALCILPFFTPAAVPGVTLGCLLGNIAGGAALPDILFGTLATFIGAVLSYALRNRSKWLVCIPPIASNMLIIPFVLRFAYGITDSIPFLMLTIGIGEVLAVGVLGNILMCALLPKRDFIFSKNMR